MIYTENDVFYIDRNIPSLSVSLPYQKNYDQNQKNKIKYDQKEGMFFLTNFIYVLYESITLGLNFKSILNKVLKKIKMKTK
jgi:hypothetical protein